MGAGLLLYDLMSGKSTMGPTRILGPRATVERIPNMEAEGLSGSVLYHDGQFNDARLALALARTAQDHGATVLNYARCSRFVHEGEKISGAVVTDVETGVEHAVKARVVFNATGIFTDQLRKMDDATTPPLLTVSRGTHIVVRADVLGGSAGIMVPKTRDGRVIFAIPWQGRVVVGTTDLPAPQPQMEPGHTPDEIAFLLETVNPFLAKKIGEEDILSVFSGFATAGYRQGRDDFKISREHHIDVSPKGLITVAGGKWTTYRRMAEDAIHFAANHALLAKRPCVTATTKLHGAQAALEQHDPYLSEYGLDGRLIGELIAAQPAMAAAIEPELPYSFAQALFAVRHEMARTLEDVLSRRTRALLLDSAAALRAAPRVAALMAEELGHDGTWVTEQVRQFAALVRTDYSR